MKILILSVIMIMMCSLIQGQNLIGLKPKEIREYMKENRKDMNINDVTNRDFNYFKYSDNSDSETVIFFLTRDSICNNVRQIIDISLKAQKVKELNARYLKNGENKWIDKHDNKEYLIQLIDEKWSCIISIETKK